MVEQYLFGGVVAENHASSYVSMDARSLIRIINCHVLKQIAQHGNKLKRIQNGQKVRTDLVSRAIRVFNIWRCTGILAAHVVGENTSGVLRTLFVCSAGMLAAPIRLLNY